MERAEIGDADRQLAVRVQLAVKNQAVTRAVHRFKTHDAVVRVEVVVVLVAIMGVVVRLCVAALMVLAASNDKHVVAIVFPVTRDLPQLFHVDLGRDHLLIGPRVVQRAHEVHQLSINV